MECQRTLDIKYWRPDSLNRITSDGYKMLGRPHTIKIRVSLTKERNSFILLKTVPKPTGKILRPEKLLEKTAQHLSEHFHDNSRDNAIPCRALNNRDMPSNTGYGSVARNKFYSFI